MDRTVEDLNRAIETAPVGQSAVLEWVLPELRQMFGTQAAAWRMVRTPAGWKAEDLNLDGFRQESTFRKSLARFMARAPRSPASYDPLRPAARDRNRVVARSTIARSKPLETIPVWREVFAQSELRHCDQLRVLLCDGGLLLNTVGLYAPDTFPRRTQRALSAIVPVLRDRLMLEQYLDEALLQRSALDAALEALGMAAFVVDDRGRIELANSAGKARLDGRRDIPRRCVEAIRAGGSPAFELVFASLPGFRRRWIALETAERGVGGKVSAAATRWHLTERQRRVLAHIAEGRPNKTIAAQMGCAENTVEYHVTRILERAQVASRAELVAAVWTES